MDNSVTNAQVFSYMKAKSYRMQIEKKVNM